MELVVSVRQKRTINNKLRKKTRDNEFKKRQTNAELIDEKNHQRNNNTQWAQKCGIVYEKAAEPQLNAP